jgi:hypothetical protein
MGSGHVFEAKIPVYAAKTPVYGAKIPVFDVKIPVYGAKIPVFEAKIPVYAAKIPVYGAKIPVFGLKMPVFEAKTHRRDAQGAERIFSHGWGTDLHRSGLSMFFICVHRCASVAKTLSVPYCVEVLLTAETRRRGEEH